ncbi:MAG TPA: hypothetical protein PLE74_07315 [Candidatus Cloacimonadota bacterium]|nr:hypothetical protein [Candidatus Cloacimonadota bacterium]
MKQEQLISYSLIIFLVIPLIVTTLGGLLVLSNPVTFYQYAKFLYGLTISMGFLLFALRNVKIYIAWYYILLLSIILTLLLKNSFLFSEVGVFKTWLIIFVFYAGMIYCIKNIFLNRSLRSVRTLLFSVFGAVVFTIMFIILLMLAQRPLHKSMLFSDFGMGFMLFAIIGIGFLISDMILNALAFKFDLRPDLNSPLPPKEESDDQIIDDTDTSDKDENDQDSR